MTAWYGKSNMHWAGIFCNKDLFLDYCARYQTWFIVQSKKETKSLNPFQSTMKLICIQIKLHDMDWIQCHSKLKLRWTSIVCLAYECNWLKYKSKSSAIVKLQDKCIHLNLVWNFFSCTNQCILWFYAYFVAIIFQLQFTEVIQPKHAF